MLAAKRNRSQLKKKALGKSKNLVVKEKCSQQKKQTNPPPPPKKKNKNMSRQNNKARSKRKSAGGKRKWLTAKRKENVTVTKSCSLKSAKSECLVFKN